MITAANHDLSVREVLDAYPTAGQLVPDIPASTKTHAELIDELSSKEAQRRRVMPRPSAVGYAGSFGPKSLAT